MIFSLPILEKQKKLFVFFISATFFVPILALVSSASVFVISPPPLPSATFFPTSFWSSEEFH